MADKIWLGGSTSSVNSLNVAANWSPSGVPSGSDNIYITSRSTVSILNDLATLAAVTGELHIQEGYGKVIGGTTRGYMEIKPSKVYFGGRGLAYVDVKASTGVVTVTNSRAMNYRPGLYLKGSALNTLEVKNGSVGFAYDVGETSSVKTVMAYGGELTLGAGVTGTTLIAISGGTVKTFAGSTAMDVSVYGGQFHGDRAWQCRNLNSFGGVSRVGGTGAIASVTIRGGGTVDASKSGQARTFASVNINVGNFSYDPDVVTVTSLVTSDRPITLSARSL